MKASGNSITKTSISIENRPHNQTLTELLKSNAELLTSRTNTNAKNLTDSNTLKRGILVNDNSYKMLVSRRKFLTYWEMTAMLVSDAMSKNLKSISPHATISSAGSKMKEFSIRHLLVVEEKTGTLLGLISDRDIKKIVSPFAGSEQATERDNSTLQVAVQVVMRKNPITIGGGENLKNAAELMLRKKVSCLPVVDITNTPIGILTTDDMIRSLIKLL